MTKKTECLIQICNGTIENCNSSAQKIFGDISNDAFENIFAEKLSYLMKIAQLQNFGSCNARLLDHQGHAFWAKISFLSSNTLLIQDIDQIKRFEINTEDLIEEEERRQAQKVCFNAFEVTSTSQIPQTYRQDTSSSHTFS
ncbi:MAG: hypothetical protein IJ022_06345 [Burkholderiaceae bacterium]|nr:hypothetical protein [Burkholderiaceae bacterium]